MWPKRPELFRYVPRDPRANLVAISNTEQEAFVKQACNFDSNDPNSLKSPTAEGAERPPSLSAMGSSEMEVGLSVCTLLIYWIFLRPDLSCRPFNRSCRLSGLSVFVTNG